jgi:NAD(P)-dependent dehydrogenase (short-subunit alcohol dehydrogenase family)
MSTNSKTLAGKVACVTGGSRSLGAAIAKLMNQRLADAVDLQTQMKPAHWNVKGRLSKPIPRQRSRSAKRDAMSIQIRCARP